MRDTTRRSTRCLFSSPMPATRPTSSHCRSSPPPRIRATRYTSVTQNSTSKVVVESRCPTAIAAPDAAVASAATACPARPAPSSRAIKATSTTTRLSQRPTRSVVRAGLRRTSIPRSGRAAESGPADRRIPKRDVGQRRGSTARRGGSRNGSPSQRAAAARRPRPEARATRRLGSPTTHHRPTVSRPPPLPTPRDDGIRLGPAPGPALSQTLTSSLSRARLHARRSPSPPRSSWRWGPGRGGPGVTAAVVAATERVLGVARRAHRACGVFGACTSRSCSASRTDRRGREHPHERCVGAIALDAGQLAGLVRDAPDQRHHVREAVP